MDHSLGESVDPEGAGAVTCGIRPTHDSRSRRGGEAYGPYVVALRRFLDHVADCRPPQRVLNATARALDDLSESLRPYLVAEQDRIAGWRSDLPGRGNPLLVPVVIDEQSDWHMKGHVRFTPFHRGGHGAAHGGTLPLLFDDVLGRLSNGAGRPRARTASLTVDYRIITPIDVDLVVEASVDRIEGRKRWASGRLLDTQGRVLVDAVGLFVELRPGQP